MEQAIKRFKTAHAEKVACDQLIKDLWKEYQDLGGCREKRQNLDKKAMKVKKKIMKKRSAAIVQCGNLSQKSNIAERKMIEAILKS